MYVTGRMSPKKLIPEDFPNLVGLKTTFGLNEEKIWDEEALKNYLEYHQKHLTDIWYIVTPGTLWTWEISNLINVPEADLIKEIETYFYPPLRSEFL